MNIDETLRALCAKHDLTAISLHFRHDGRPYANAHWENSGGTCAGRDGATVAEAVANTIREANELRAVAPEVPTLELGEIVA